MLFFVVVVFIINFLFLQIKSNVNSSRETWFHTKQSKPFAIFFLQLCFFSFLHFSVLKTLESVFVSVLSFKYKCMYVNDGSLIEIFHMIRPFSDGKSIYLRKMYR